MQYKSGTSANLQACLRQGFVWWDPFRRIVRHLSQSTISRVIITWANLPYLTLVCTPIWPTIEQVNKNMPNCFKHLWAMASHVSYSTVVKYFISHHRHWCSRVNFFHITNIIQHFLSLVQFEINKLCIQWTCIQWFLGISQRSCP